MIKTKKIKYRRLMNELEYLYEEHELLGDIVKDAAQQFEIYYREFCARNNIDIDKLNEQNKQRIASLYGVKPDEVKDNPVSEYTGSTEIIKVDEPDEQFIVEETAEEIGVFKKLHEDFNKLFKKLAMKLHPDRIENYTANDEYKQKLSWDFSKAKSALDRKDYFKLIQLAKKYDIHITENYTLLSRWFRKDRDKVAATIAEIKTTYNYQFAECETDEEKDVLIKKFIWHIFRVQAWLCLHIVLYFKSSH